MINLIIIFIPILLTDVINPVLLAATIYAVGTDRPYANSLALLCGHTAAYLLAGILIALGMNRIDEHAVAHRVTMLVVEPLESVDIGKQQAEWMARTGARHSRSSPPMSMSDPWRVLEPGGTPT